MKEEMLEKLLNAQKNLIVEGDVSSGKTTNVFFPIVEKIINKRENLFIIDSKEEYINKYYQKLKSNDYNTIIINLRDLKKSEGWNPLEYPYNLYKNGNTDKALEYLDKIGKTIFYESNASVDPFWTNSATDFFTGIALALFQDGNESEINFNSINNMFLSLDKKMDEINYLSLYFNSKDKNDIAYSYASTTLLAPVETRGGILATARLKLRTLVSRELLSQLMKKTTFEFENFTNKPTAIIFIAKDESKYLNGLLTMFIEQLYGKLIDSKERCKFNFILDNFDIIEHQNELPEMLGSCLSRNIKLFIGTRSLEEFLTKYGSYCQKLCNLLKIQNDKVAITIDNNVEEIEKEFSYVIIGNDNIEYPNLNVSPISTFNVEEKVVPVKKEQDNTNDFTNSDVESKPFNVDDILKRIDEKIAQLEAEGNLRNDIYEDNTEPNYFNTND